MTSKAVVFSSLLVYCTGRRACQNTWRSPDAWRICLTPELVPSAWHLSKENLNKLCSRSTDSGPCHFSYMCFKVQRKRGQTCFSNLLLPLTWHDIVMLYMHSNKRLLQLLAEDQHFFTIRRRRGLTLNGTSHGIHFRDGLPKYLKLQQMHRSTKHRLEASTQRAYPDSGGRLSYAAMVKAYQVVEVTQGLRACKCWRTGSKLCTLLPSYFATVFDTIECYDL